MNNSQRRRSAAWAHSVACIAGPLAIWLLAGLANSPAIAADASQASAASTSQSAKTGKSHTGAGEDPSNFRPAISATLPAYSGDWLGDLPILPTRSGDVDLSQIHDPLPSSTNRYLASTPLPPSSDAPILSERSDPFFVDIRQKRDAKKHKLADPN
jgi:hypothetical protein